MRIKHTIRTSENGRVELDLTPGLAIKLKCVDCLGYETHPSTCTATLCPLYPFRGNSMLSRHGYTKRELTEEQRQIAVERFRALRKEPKS
jgi:hypothetical protein